MAFPFIFHENFELGTLGGYDSETDTASQLDYPHYSELARFPWPKCAPYTGAYCMRTVLSGGTADAYVVEGSVDIAAAATRYVRFNMWFSPTFDATADDTVNVLELLATATVEVTFGFRYVAATDVINLGIGELAPTSFGAAIKKGVWYTVELTVVVDNAGADDGTIDIYVTEDGAKTAGAVYATQVGSLDQGAVTTSRFGVQDHLATTTGTILFDNFMFDDGRLYSDTDRYPVQRLITKSEHVFVGQGTLENVSLLSGAGTDNVLTCFDTDTGDTNDPSNVVLELKNTANNELVDPAATPASFTRGCFVQLTGTNPRAIVRYGNCPSYSAAGVRNLGLKRGAI